MTNKEKLIAIIGEENFRKLERNLDPKHWHTKNIDELINTHLGYSIDRAFLWKYSVEGRDFWGSLHEKVIREWEEFGLRKISPEEHELIFKMFVMEWMQYPQRENKDWYDLLLSEGVGLKIYEALRSE